MSAFNAARPAIEAALAADRNPKDVLRMIREAGIPMTQAAFSRHFADTLARLGLTEPPKRKKRTRRALPGGQRFTTTTHQLPNAQPVRPVPIPAERPDYSSRRAVGATTRTALNPAPTPPAPEPGAAAPIEGVDFASPPPDGIL
jgi:hypothetical protein